MVKILGWHIGIGDSAKDREGRIVRVVRNKPEGFAIVRYEDGTHGDEFVGNLEKISDDEIAQMIHDATRHDTTK